MERLYRFADITFRITGKDCEMYQEDGILAPFRVTEQLWDHNIDFAILDQLPAPEGDCVFRTNRIQVFRTTDTQISFIGAFEDFHTRICRQGNRTLVQVLKSQVPERIMPRLVLNTLEVEHHIARHGGILLHSSFIRVGEEAILFTAPSGTGKSTQAELWRKLRGAQIINGDRTAVVPMHKEVMAYGIPYCGTSGICRNAKLPVSAIVCLSQAPETRIEPLFGFQAFRSLWKGCSINLWDQEDVDICIRTVTKILQQVPVVHLACTPDESAVEILEAYLKRGI